MLSYSFRAKLSSLCEAQMLQSILQSMREINILPRTRTCQVIRPSSQFMAPEDISHFLRSLGYVFFSLSRRFDAKVP